MRILQSNLQAKGGLDKSRENKRVPLENLPSPFSPLLCASCSLHSG